MLWTKVRLPCSSNPTAKGVRTNRPIGMTDRQATGSNAISPPLAATSFSMSEVETPSSMIRIRVGTVSSPARALTSSTRARQSAAVVTNTMLGPGAPTAPMNCLNRWSSTRARTAEKENRTQARARTAPCHRERLVRSRRNDRVSPQKDNARALGLRISPSREKVVRVVTGHVTHGPAWSGWRKHHTGRGRLESSSLMRRRFALGLRRDPSQTRQVRQHEGRGQ